MSSSNTTSQNKRKGRRRPVLPVDSPSLDIRLTDPQCIFFYQQGPVLYFYCSKKVHQNYAAEGLSNERMPFEEFVAKHFSRGSWRPQRNGQRKRWQKKRKRLDSQKTGRLCRFCHLELRQGPNSPHIHTGFPGVPGNYIYCPSKVSSLYRDKGKAKKMNWNEFQESPFYEPEKQRWVEEKN